PRPGTPLAAVSSAAGHSPPDIIPLDDPAPAGAIAFPGPPPTAAAKPQPSAPATLTPPGPAAASAPPPEAKATGPSAAPAAAALPHGGHFAWPVRGHVVAGYGVAPGGAHNDGINIAAPKGASVAAIDSGVRAYGGNEIGGSGHPVLVKHPSGWISAYAHCEELLVKKGDKVSAGQTIAK